MMSSPANISMISLIPQGSNNPKIAENRVSLVDAPSNFTIGSMVSKNRVCLSTITLGLTWRKIEQYLCPSNTQSFINTIVL